MHVFGQWEETRVPGENPRTHGENIQTPSLNLNLEPSCCEATVLTTTPPCSSIVKSFEIKIQMSKNNVLVIFQLFQLKLLIVTACNICVVAGAYSSGVTNNMNHRTLLYLGFQQWQCAES